MIGRSLAVSFDRENDIKPSSKDRRMLIARQRLVSTRNLAQGICRKASSSAGKSVKIVLYQNFASMTTASAKSLDGDLTGSHKTMNAWQQPGPASYDFRSDTMTTPTASMLDAITNTTLLDDVFLEDPTTNDLEAMVASLTGHEAALACYVRHHGKPGRFTNASDAATPFCSC